MSKPQLLEDEIGRKLAEAESSGELKAAKGYGEPLQHDAGWEQTPDSLRMPFKILKDAGFVPHEVEMMRERAELRLQLATETDSTKVKAIQVRLAALEQSISLRLESLRNSS